MKPRSYTSEGLILNKRNLGEADKIITVFSKDFGKFSLVAKGIRKPKSRKRGHLEIFNQLKFQGISGSSMDIMIEAQEINDFLNIRKSLNKISLAYYFCEVVNKITNEHEENFLIYKLLLNSLNKLSRTNLLRDLRLNFIHELLVIAGYHPKNEKLIDHDKVLEDVIERRINSLRVGKRMLQ